MRLSKFLGLLFIIVFCTSSHAQTIVAVSSKFVLLDATQNPNIKIGNEYFVLKQLDSGDIVQIGKIRILKVIKGKLAGRIIAQSPNYTIEKGDFLRMPVTGGKKNNFVTFASIGAGLAAAGLGYHYSTQADEMYEDYKKATTTVKAIGLYEDTKILDRKSQVGYSVGGTLATMGLLYAIMNSGQPVGDYLEPPGQSNFFSYGSMGAGLIAAGVGYYFNTQANDTYDKYEKATTVEDAKKYFDDTESLDRQSQILYGVGGALFAFGLIHKLSSPSQSSSTNDTPDFSLMPVHKKGYFGFSAKLCLNHPPRQKTSY